MNISLSEICGGFITSPVLSVQPLGGGNINDTYLADTGNGSFVLQRLQKAMDTRKLTYNYELYSPLFGKEGIAFPKWLNTREGGYFLHDRSGGAWRMYSYIEGDILTPPLEKAELYACGRGLGKMHLLLSRLPRSPKAVYPKLHDLEHYYDRFLHTLQSKVPEANNRDMGTEKKLHDLVLRHLSEECGRNDIIHGDPKLGNIIFQGGSVKGFIDLDTVMTGSAAEDAADCIRSCCVKDGTLDRDAAYTLLEGYISVTGNTHIRDDVPRSFDKICCELALRYYTDSVSSEKVFREKYPGYHLERAKALLSLSWESQG